VDLRDYRATRSWLSAVPIVVKVVAIWEELVSVDREHRPAVDWDSVPVTSVFGGRTREPAVIVNAR
jgi:hypothetical protein